MPSIDSLLIRPYCDGDFKDVARNLEDGSLYDADVDGREQWNALIAYDPNALLVADNRSVAVGNVFIIFNPWFSSIWHLAVRKEFRGIGIGERLMHAAEESIRDHGCNYSSLFVKSSEGSLVEYYGTQGYALWGESILNLNKKLV